MKWNQGKGTNWKELYDKKVVAIFFGDEHQGRQVRTGYIQQCSSYPNRSSIDCSHGEHDEYFVSAIEFWVTEEEFLKEMGL